MLSSPEAVMLKRAHESLEREEEKERQPAGGGKTKGKVKESKRGRGEVGEGRGRMGDEKRIGGQVEGGWEALCMGLRSIPLVFGRTSSAPPAEWQPGWTSPLWWPGGEEGSVAAVVMGMMVLWPFVRPAVCSAGSTIQYFEDDQRGKNILLYFYTTDLLKEGRRRKQSYAFTFQPCC